MRFAALVIAILAGASPLTAAETLDARLPAGGYRDVVWREPQGWQTIDVTAAGIVPGDADHTERLRSLIADLDEPTILYFPAGTYRFGELKIRRGNLIIRGEGPDRTIFRPTHDGTIFYWEGKGGQYDYKYLDAEYQPRPVTADVPPGATTVPIADTQDLKIGDTVLIEADLDRWSYPSARRGLGGVFTIAGVEKDNITLDAPLVIGLPDASKRQAVVAKMEPVRNVSLEGVRIVMPDERGAQGALMRIRRVANARIRNVESRNPNGHHVEIAWSREVVVEGCFFDEAKYKGPGDHNGYGVLFRDLSTLCKAENNIFRDLRHTMATEVGANLCVFAYNLNVDRVRDLAHSPNPPAECRDEKWINSRERNGISNAYVTADVVAHGNYPHNILFEGNIFYDASVDHSHHVNGPHVFFRNRVLGQPPKYGYWQEGVGINVMGDNDDQVIVGNHLLNESIIELQKHTYERTSHNTLIGGNVIGGKVDWGHLSPDTKLPESLYLSAKPGFWPSDLAWPPFGPGVDGSATNSIPAQARYSVLLKSGQSQAGQGE